MNQQFIRCVSYTKTRGMKWKRKSKDDKILTNFDIALQKIKFHGKLDLR